jgi:hypothetical protein
MISPRYVRISGIDLLSLNPEGVNTMCEPFLVSAHGGKKTRRLAFALNDFRMNDIMGNNVWNRSSIGQSIDRMLPDAGSKPAGSLPLIGGSPLI